MRSLAELEYALEAATAAPDLHAAADEILKVSEEVLEHWIVAKGDDPGGVAYGDLSTSGADPDPNGDSSPDERTLSVFNKSQVPVELLSLEID